MCVVDGAAGVLLLLLLRGVAAGFVEAGIGAEVLAPHGFHAGGWWWVQPPPGSWIGHCWDRSEQNSLNVEVVIGDVRCSWGS